MKCQFEETPENVQVVAVLRNDAGATVGGDATSVERLRCEEGSAFSIDTLARIPGATKVEVFANL